MNYDTPEGVHQVMTMGRYTIFRHDYDGSIVVVVEGTNADGKGFYVDAKHFEAAICKLGDEHGFND